MSDAMVPVYHGPYDAKNVTRDLTRGPRTDARALMPPPLAVSVTRSTGTNPAVGDVMRGQTSDVSVVVTSIPDGDEFIALSYSRNNLTDGETLDNETSGVDDFVVDGASALGSNTGGMIQPLMGDPGSGVAGYLGKWASPNIARRRCELMANTLTADFRSVGWEGSPTLTGTAAAKERNNGMYLQFTTPATTVGSWAGVRTALDLFRWKWDNAPGVWVRTGLTNNSRIWVAFTSAGMDGKREPNGSGDVTAAFRVDWNNAGGAQDTKFHCMTWGPLTDGAAHSLNDTTLTIDAAASTVYYLSVQYDTAASEVRFYIYDWAGGINHGLVHTQPLFVSNNDKFGVDALVEVVVAGAAQTFEVARIINEHDS